MLAMLSGRPKASLALLCALGLLWAQGAGVLALIDRSIPPLERGKGNYKWLLNERERERGISYFGSAERLRAKMKDMSEGKQVKLVSIGGSITAGQGCEDAPSWSAQLFDYLADNMPVTAGGTPSAVGQISGVGGIMSTYMAVCHNMHVPKDTDIVFVEFSVNDPPTPGPHPFQNEFRAAYERLIRSLLNLPKKPAVILIHSYQWHASHAMFKGEFWSNAERELGEFALYYGLPQISVKAACHHNMVKDVKGFSVQRNRMEDKLGLRDVAFYFDPIHPDGRTGSRIMAELSIHVLLKALNSTKERPITPEELAEIQEPLPLPMIPRNEASANDKCFIGQHFKDTVIAHDPLWEWVNDSKTPRPKWGYASNVTGQTIRMKIDTRSGVVQGDIIIELAYLKSYEHMGTGLVRCESGCGCAETKIQGHGQERNSQLHLHRFKASQSPDCVIAVSVLDETLSGERRVKLAGIMISEVQGEAANLEHPNAVQVAGGTIEYVHDIATRDSNGLYLSTNHARRHLIEKEQKEQRHE